MTTRRGARIGKRSVRTPGGKSSKHRKVGKAKSSKCAKCGRELGGTPRGRTGKMRGVAKSCKHPTRKFAGYFCAACSRELIKNAARA